MQRAPGGRVRSSRAVRGSPPGAGQEEEEEEEEEERAPGGARSLVWLPLARGYLLACLPWRSTATYARVGPTGLLVRGS